METTCVIQKPQKKQKLNEEEDIDGNSKCLGNLPDEVLRHIISFLPTSDAVRTSVLSRRWEYVWASIPHLDFARKSANRNLLMDFVDRALCLRDSSIMKRFSLSCDVLGDASRVYTWISTVVRRHNVQELHIKLRKVEGFAPLPYCLFTSNTLTSLHLDMSYILKVPTTICFSSLKILGIERVTFSNEYLTQQLFSGLPVLEELKLINCSWGNLKFVSISAPKLHSLSIFENELPDIDFEYFWSSSDFCQVMIVGDSLKEFYYNSYLICEYCLYNSFSLEKAEIDSEWQDDVSEQIALRMLNLLVGLFNVEQLTLSSLMIGVLMDAKGHLSQMPMFNNLMDLIFVGGLVYLDCPALFKILQKSPCLKTLNFCEGLLLSGYWKNDDWMLNPVPPCFLSHLKWIKVKWIEVDIFYGKDEDQLSAVKFFLKNAVVLDEIIITCSEHFEGNLETQLKFAKQLLELPRGSQNCKIILE
ncbi:F-box/LRR-repeat protein At2g29930-like isoform X2 [Corylus avellana]|nr:F-box/LRR-repeat protein At2g29930-like isoform X2 [Corylus avellana]